MSYTIYKRPDSPDLWVRWTIDGRRVRRSLGTSEPDVAEILAADAHRKALLGELARDANTLTLDQALGRYVMEHARHLPSLPTVIHQAKALRRLVGKATPLSAIDDAALTKFIAHRRGEQARRGHGPRKGRRSIAMAGRLVSSTTVNKEVSLLRAVMNRADAKWKLTVGKVDWKSHRLQEADPPTRWLTPAEVERLLAAAAPHLRPLIVTALATGLRSANVHRLDWSQVDLATRTLTVRVKSRRPGGKLLSLPIVEPLLVVLANLQPKPAGPVFLFDRKPIRTDARRAFLSALKRAGIDRKITWHDLRHTAASWLVQRGVPLQVVKELLGHSDIKLTQRYAHLAPGQSTEAMKLLGSALSGVTAAAAADTPVARDSRVVTKRPKKSAA